MVPPSLDDVLFVQRVPLGWYKVGYSRVHTIHHRSYLTTTLERVVDPGRESSSLDLQIDTKYCDLRENRIDV